MISSSSQTAGPFPFPQEVGREKLNTRGARLEGKLLCPLRVGWPSFVPFFPTRVVAADVVFRLDAGLSTGRDFLACRGPSGAIHRQDSATRTDTRGSDTSGYRKMMRSHGQSSDVWTKRRGSTRRKSHSPVDHIRCSVRHAHYLHIFTSYS